MSIQQTFYQIIIGVLLAYSLYITGSLLAPMVMHFANNFSIILLTTFALINGVDATEVATFTSFFDYAQVFIYTAIGAVIVGALFKILKNQTKQRVLEQEIITESQEMLASAKTNLLLQGEDEEINEELKEQILIKTQKAVDKKSYKLLVLGVLIGIIFWIFNFITNIG